MTEREKLNELLERIDGALDAKRYRDAVSAIVQVLERIEFSALNLGGNARAYDRNALDDANRLANAITRLMIDVDYQITEGDLVRLAVFKRTTAQVFEISNFQGSRHFLRQLAVPKQDGSLSLSAQATAKLLLVTNINDLNLELLELLKKQDARIGVALLVGFLSEQVTWSANAKAVRCELLKLTDHWQVDNIHTLTVGALVPAYMGCSYDESPHKHDIKRFMNRLIRSHAERAGCVELEVSKPSMPRARPVVVVIAELYAADHAVHRVFGADIQSLMSRFDTVLMSTGQRIDPRLEPYFTSIDPVVFDSKNPKAYCSEVLKHQPDVIYYPSIGMRPISLLLSNLRLAPIQIMTYGHTATTCSEQIDYGIIPEAVMVGPETVTETILLRPNDLRFLDHPDAPDIKAEVRENPDTVNIAVPAWIRKVSPGFVDACQRIARESQRPIHFVFFPNCVGSAYQAFRRRIESLLPATALPTDNYSRYIDRLNQCDIFLSSFPFGATNGIIDAAGLGLPVVNLKGKEMHSITDSKMCELLGLPSWLSTETVDEYVATVLKLIHDDQLRVSISRDFMQSDVGSVFLHDREVPSFADIFHAVYRRHDEMRSQGKHVWRYEELLELNT